ncbi:MAG: hypothetical protein KDA81_12935 [Planctomycetaceae bacterium]|nr:hypothetical protein [Planctomycetaceae bacterium]
MATELMNPQTHSSEYHRLGGLCVTAVCLLLIGCGQAGDRPWGRLPQMAELSAAETSGKQSRSFEPQGDIFGARQSLHSDPAARPHDTPAEQADSDVMNRAIHDALSFPVPAASSMEFPSSSELPVLNDGHDCALTLIPLGDDPRLGLTKDSLPEGILQTVGCLDIVRHLERELVLRSVDWICISGRLQDVHSRTAPVHISLRTQSAASAHSVADQLFPFTRREETTINGQYALRCELQDYRSEQAWRSRYVNIQHQKGAHNWLVFTEPATTAVSGSDVASGDISDGEFAASVRGHIHDATLLKATNSLSSCPSNRMAIQLHLRLHDHSPLRRFFPHLLTASIQLPTDDSSMVFATLNTVGVQQADTTARQVAAVLQQALRRPEMLAGRPELTPTLLSILRNVGQSVSVTVQDSAVILRSKSSDRQTRF